MSLDLEESESDTYTCSIWYHHSLSRYSGSSVSSSYRDIHDTECYRVASQLLSQSSYSYEDSSLSYPRESSEEISNYSLFSQSVSAEEEKQAFIPKGVSCDICGKTIEFVDYPEHLLMHERNEMKMTIKVPCEICKEIVDFANYQAHMEAHKNSELSIFYFAMRRKIGDFNITCDLCGEELRIKEYAEHIEFHQMPPPEELPETTAGLPRGEYTGAGVEKACTICLQDYQMEDKLAYLPCAHYFHEGCIIKWVKRQGTCPICKKRVLKQ